MGFDEWATSLGFPPASLDSQQAESLQTLYAKLEQLEPEGTAEVAPPDQAASEQAVASQGKGGPVAGRAPHTQGRHPSDVAAAAGPRYTPGAHWARQQTPRK